MSQALTLESLLERLFGRVWIDIASCRYVHWTPSHEHWKGFSLWSGRRKNLKPTVKRFLSSKRISSHRSRCCNNETFWETERRPIIRLQLVRHQWWLINSSSAKSRETNANVPSDWNLATIGHCRILHRNSITVNQMPETTQINGNYASKGSRSKLWSAWLDASRLKSLQKMQLRKI